MREKAGVGDVPPQPRQRDSKPGRSQNKNHRSRCPPHQWVTPPRARAKFPTRAFLPKPEQGGPSSRPGLPLGAVLGKLLNSPEAQCPHLCDRPTIRVSAADDSCKSPTRVRALKSQELFLLIGKLDEPYFGDWPWETYAAKLRDPSRMWGQSLPPPLPALTRPSQPRALRSKFNPTFEGQSCVGDANIRLLPLLASPRLNHPVRSV